MTKFAGPVDVVVIGPDYLDSFASNIADGFDDLGVSSRVVDPFARFAAVGRSGPATRVRSAVGRALGHWGPGQATLIDRPVATALQLMQPRLVLSVFGYFEPAQVEKWRRSTPGATWAVWYPDSFVNLGAHRVLLAPYDHFFFKDPYFVDLLTTRAGIGAHYLAQACNPRHHRPPRDAEANGDAQCDVVLVGNLYPYRLLTLEHLDPKYHLRIYGNQRSPLPSRFSRVADAHTGQVVFGAEKARVFAGARIVLNTMHYGEVQGVNSRLFEATGSGGFVLTHSNDALSRYFEIDREVATFETPAEMNAAIARYLADPAARASVAAAGSARTHRDHTYPVRLAELLDTCGVRDDLSVAGGVPT